MDGSNGFVKCPGRSPVTEKHITYLREGDEFVNMVRLITVSGGDRDMQCLNPTKNHVSKTKRRDYFFFNDSFIM